MSTCEEPVQETSPTKGYPITDIDVADAAAKYEVDPRTILRALAGLPVRGRSGERARRAAAALLGRAPERLAATDGPRSTAAPPPTREAAA
jgi:hypothetical protein